MYLNRLPHPHRSLGPQVGLGRYPRLGPQRLEAGHLPYRLGSSPGRGSPGPLLERARLSPDLGQALTRVHEELAGVPLSGLVVLSDGADNADNPLGDALLPLQAAGVPVFTVGLGREEYASDIQLSRVETPRGHLHYGLRPDRDPDGLQAPGAADR